MYLMNNYFGSEYLDNDSIRVRRTKMLFLEYQFQ